ncbi:MAG: protein kinase [Myxococcales bacterium]|nr:protein kinase [Myxococcales bacterium]
MRSVAVLIILGLLLAMGCSAPVDGPERPPPERVRAYSGTWEYRYGESPIAPDGRFLWSLPDEARSDPSAGWRPTQQTHNPPGRSGHAYLWLRTRVPPLAADPWGASRLILQLDFVEQSFEAFLDGQMIERFGVLDGPTARRFPGFQNHFLPLPERVAGRLLVIRVYSPHARIGFPTPQHLGEYTHVLSAVVQEGLGPALIGVLLLTAGLALLSLFLVQRSETDLLLYGLCLLSLGVYVLCRSTIRSYFISAAVVWYYVELSSLCFSGGFLSLFVARMLGRDRLNLLPALAALFFLYFAFASLLVISGRVHIVNTSEILKYLFLLFMLLVIGKTLASTLRGELYGRMLSVGLLIAAAFATWQVLQEMRVLPRTGFLGHYPAALFALTLGVILSHRVRRAQRQLADYSTLMQLNFESARTRSPRQHAHRVLAELLRMLQAERALLFTCDDDGNAVKLLAARDARGDVSSAVGEEHPSIPAPARHALATRQVTAEQRVADDSLGARVAADLGMRFSELAVPLLVHDQLLGVLYLHDSVVGIGHSERVLVQGLSRQIALHLLGARTSTLEQQTQHAQRLLDEQQQLLLQVGRLARGDLQSPITVPTESQLSALAGLLDGMRRDLAAKIAELTSSRVAAQKLNEELRFQIEQRIQRLLDQALSSGSSSHPFQRSQWLEAGELLGDGYRVVGVLGQGASGSVYDVERLRDGRRLAAKVISAKAQKEAILQFAREAQILARLSDPHVAAIVDVDLTDTRLLFLVMERVPGTPLSQCMDRYRDVRGACRVLSQIASGLRTVHAHGVVHRDLKPANVLVAQVDGEPQAKLVDFGLSTLSQQEAVAREAREQPGLLVGSPMYVAPELYVGSHRAQPPSDIFSLGVIAYELLIGVLPFSRPPVVSRYRGEALQLRSVQSLRSDLPDSLSALISRCLAEDPAQRPSADELFSALATWATHDDSHAKQPAGGHAR